MVLWLFGSSARVSTLVVGITASSVLAVHVVAALQQFVVFQTPPPTAAA
jgi:hypothetical protein